MSLLDQYKEDFILMEKQRISDGEGGVKTTLVDGVTISLILRFDSSLEAKKAEAEGVNSVYTFLAAKNCGIDYHDILKRSSDGQLFRVTSNPEEMSSPASATFDLTSFSAERWELT